MYPLEHMLSPMIKDRDSIKQNLNENEIILMERIRKQKLDLLNHRISPAQVDLVRPEIVQSWIRSYNHGLDPYDFCYGPSLDAADLEKLMQEKSYLLTAAEPCIRQLESMLSDTNYLILLSDEQGIILRVTPDHNDISTDIKDRFKLAPGTLWTEETVGTVSHVMSLMLASPIQLCGPETYAEVNSHVMGLLLGSSAEGVDQQNESLNQTSCSSAPVFDAYGNLAGSITIISPYLHHQSSHTLGLAVSTAWAIQNQLQLALNSELFTVALDAAEDAVITINQSGVITKANIIAQRILNVAESNLISRSIEDVLGNQPVIESVLRTGQAVYNTEIRLAGWNQKLFLRSAQPVKDHTGRNFSCILSFRKVERIKKIEGQITGLNTRFTFHEIAGDSPLIAKSVKLAQKYARLDANILIQGESGTGKEMYAQSIHNASRPGGSFIAVNCAAIPRTLIESELFGYEGGAFTGAERQGRPGKIELANGGTLFLDEIGDMPLELQPVLLRVLEEKMVMRIGGSRYIPVDFRLITATNKSLLSLVENQLFREDLYYRLAVLQVLIPPLRERGSDIVKLARVFIGKIAAKQHMDPPVLSDAAIFHLLKYQWPGNVRQLENAVLCAVTASSNGVIDPEDFPPEVLSPASHAHRMQSIPGTQTISVSDLSLKEVEKMAIMQALLQANHNVTSAAALLGMSKSTLYRKIKGYNLLEELRNDN